MLSCLGAYGKGAVPNKETLIGTLIDLHTALVAKDGDAAMKHLIVPAEKQERVKKEVGTGWEEDNGHLNAASLALIKKKGEFEKLSDLVPKEGPRRAKRAQIPLDGALERRCIPTLADGRCRVEMGPEYDGVDRLRANQRRAYSGVMGE